MSAVLPTPGRIVQYQTIAGKVWPALVTSVNADGSVNLAVFNEDDRVRFPALFLRVAYLGATQLAEDNAPSGWFWPERVA